MDKETKNDGTDAGEQIEKIEKPEKTNGAQPARQAKETQKSKMSKLAVLSVLCLAAALAVLVMYLKSGEASFPMALEKILIPAGAAVLAVALVAGIIALVMIKASGGALGGRRLALLGIIVPIIAAVAYFRASSPIEEESQVLPSTRCRTNISRLAEMISEYRRDNHTRFPNADKWCDIVLEQVKDEFLFACPLAEGVRCSYSLNKYVVEVGDDLPEDMVLLFESKPGWNQVGGPELFTAPHESRRGNTGSVVLAGGVARFVSEEGLEELNWTGDKDSKEAEPDNAEPQAGNAEEK